MNILMLGRGKGSWQIRGQQLGAAIGARVTSAPSEADWHWAETVILVKRADPTWIQRAHALKLRVVWDAVDFWPQPLENRATETRARQLLRRQLDVIRPDLWIAATESMAREGGIYLPHHSRPGLVPTQPRETMQVVGYDGNPLYLDAWGAAIKAVCKAHGWQFIVNPQDLSTVDLLVAFRGGPWDGWICREWKSGVKLVNAIAAGRPIITQDSAAWRELQPAGSIIETTATLGPAIDAWAEHRSRSIAFAGSRIWAPQLRREAVADSYLQILGGLREAQAC